MISYAIQNINGEYFQRIFGCKKFKEDFLEYLEIYFIDDYKKEIDNKFKNLLFKWDKKFNKGNHKESFLLDVKKYLIQNKKCKLPWNLKELNDALLRIKSIANKN